LGGARASNMWGYPPWFFEKVPSRAPCLTVSVGGFATMKGCKRERQLSVPAASELGSTDEREGRKGMCDLFV
jgi:hypothetical protein